jgi:cobalt-zinc-cadmium efflux system protein
MHDHHNDHGHDHSHGHTDSHGHSHGLAQNRIGLALIITAGYMIVEAIGGFVFNSLALLADAGHMLSDVMALGLSWVAIQIGKRKPTDKHTFGFRRTEILAALINGLALWAIVAVILFEAQKRFFAPQPVAGTGMMIVATVGLAVNLIMAAVLFKSRDASLNVRSAFIHVIGDALGSVGAIVAAVGILLTGAYWLDPLLSVFVGLLIVFSSWELIKESVNVLMEGVPTGLEIGNIEAAMLESPGVCCVHDLHVWSISGDKHALAAHVVLSGPQEDGDKVIAELNGRLGELFNIRHTTIQVESTHEALSACEADLCRPGSRCSVNRMESM